MLEIKNIITEITNVFDRLTNRVNTAEERTSQLRISQLKPSEQESKQTNKKDKKKIRYRVTDCVTSTKMQHMCNENTRKIKLKKETQVIFENIMTENLSKLMPDAKPQTQEAQRIPTRINNGKTTSRHIIFKTQKIKDKETKIKEVRGEKILTCK